MSPATVTAPDDVKRSRRADAQRNHDRIVAVAREAVARVGGDIVLEDIARQAGVGIGTLYRHFPNRQALLEAAFLDEAEELRAKAEGLQDEASPLDALVEYLHQQMVFGARGRSMGAAVMNAKHTEGTDIQLACSAMREAGAALLARAQEAGQVCTGIDISDVLRLVHGIVIANEQHDEDDPQRTKRMFDLVIAGLRP